MHQLYDMFTPITIICLYAMYKELKNDLKIKNQRIADLIKEKDLKWT